MAKPYRVTGCFRFFVFIAILAPIVYIGASYYNGQDGIQNIRNLITKVKNKVGVSESVKPSTQENNTPSPSPSTVVQDEKLTELKTQVSLKDKEINALIQENLDLKQKLKELESKPANIKTPK